jgi:D-3-phosphoglycerate dehydrogenase
MDHPMSELVVITDSNLPTIDGAVDVLAEAGHDVRREEATAPDDVIAIADGAVALVVQWATIDAAVFDALPDLRIVSRLGIGYDVVDVDAATRAGVAVANTPAYCIEEVAIHSVAQITALLRGTVAYDRSVREGTWSAVGAYPAADRPSSTTVGVVGYGRIGRAVAAMLLGLGFHVVCHDPYAAIDDPRIEAVPLDALLGRSDIVTLHAPLTAETRHLIGEDAIGAMRPGTRIVNTCRGTLIDEAALARGLADGRVGGAALDVFEAEPLPADSPLRDLPNVILSPHAAWYSPASLQQLPRDGAANVVEFLRTGTSPSIVNPDYLAVARGRA